MRRAVLVTLAALALLALPAPFASWTAPPVLAAPSPPAGDATDEAINSLDTSLKTGDEAKANATIGAQESNKDPRWTAKLFEVAKGAKSDSIAATAMMQLGNRKDPAFLKWAKGRLDDKKAYDEKKANPRYVAMLKALPFYGDELKPLQGDLEDVVKKYLPITGDISGPAIHAYAAYRSPATVDTLLAWLADAENTSNGQNAKQSKETLASKAICVTAINESLKAMTHQDLADHKTWTEWWDKNRKGFKFPDLNAPKTDPATLSEYTDVAYGFIVKKPALPDFAFSQTDEAVLRIQLACVDSSGMIWGRVKAMQFKPNKDNPTPEALCRTFEKQWNEKEFAEFSKKPVVEEKKIGGRDFWVVSCKGLPKDGGAWGKWASGLELRVYVFAPSSGMLVWFETVVRTSAEQNIKDATFGAVENMTFRK